MKIKLLVVGVITVFVAISSFSAETCWVTQAFGCSLSLWSGALYSGNCHYGFANCCTGTGTYNDSDLESSGSQSYTCQSESCSGSCSGVDDVGNPFTNTGSNPTTGCPASGGSCP